MSAEFGIAGARQDGPPREAAPGKKWIKAVRVQNGIDTEVWEEVDDVAGPTWGPRERMRLVNRDLPRVDGPDKVTGRAVYTHDVRVPGMAFGQVLRCPHPWAKIRKLDLEASKQVPGVFGVVALESEEVKWIGRPIAAVAADTPEHAEDGVRAIVVEYDVQRFAITPEQSMAADAPKIAGNRDNVRVHETEGDLSAVESALAECDAVVEGAWRIPVQHHACLETHGVVVDYRGGDSATIYASTQGTFTIPGEAARKLKLNGSQVTAVVEHMGGGFGGKFGLGLEGDAACRLSKELSRPVHMLFDRTTEFLAGGNRAGGVHVLKAGAKKSGELHAFVGRVERHGGVGPGSNQKQPYIYRPKNSFVELKSVLTNTDSSRAMRAPGHPQMSFAMEGIMDDLAYAIGMDPLEFRVRNVAENRRVTYERQLRLCADLIGWNEHAHRTAPNRTNDEIKVGIGFALATWGGGGGPECKVEVRIGADGSVEVLSGTQDLGTGTRTYVTAIVAEELGLEMSQVTAKIGRSSYGAANASGGSTTTASLAPAVKHAAWNARKQLAEKVGVLLGVDPVNLRCVGGRIEDSTNPGSNWIGFKDACATIGGAGLSAQGEWQSQLAASGVGGAQAAKVQVDTLTGEINVLHMVGVQDCGLVMNRLATRSQLNGGMIQALSYGLFEERVVDPDLGLVLNANFEDYKIAGCKEIGLVQSVLDDADTRGVIGMAEPAVVPGQSAIANAIMNACGARLREMPLTSDKLLMELRGMKRG